MKFGLALLQEKLRKKYKDFSPARSIDKLVAVYSLAIEKPNIKINKDCHIQRIRLNCFYLIDRDLHCCAGLFYKLFLKSLNDLHKIIIRKDQIIGIYGIKKKAIIKFIEKYQPKGIDRVVPIGKMMNFSNIWDGYDLLREFCREIILSIHFLNSK
jgi:hypothetical protein